MKQSFNANMLGRMHRGARLGAVLATLSLAGLTGLGGCQDPNAGGAPIKHGAADASERPGAVSAAAVLEQAKAFFSPLPKVAQARSNPITNEKVSLGRMLYFDERLSKNHDLSCASCHDLENYGIDSREDDGKRAKTSSGHRDQKGDRNSPTVYNAGLHFTQFWDGRASDLEAQAKGPVLNPVEMAMADEATVVATLASIPGYVEAFSTAFPGEGEPVTYDNMAQAIGAFERKLITPAPFDEFLGGNLTALTEEQMKGLDLFMSAGCPQCHTGPAVGGTMFQKLGTIKPWENLKDKGRAEVTKAKADEFIFKVPSLRNITETGPYLHDGSIASLEEIVQKMATHQLAKGELTPDELSAILAFLGSLKGELPTADIAKPTLPASGPSTPPPNPA